MVRESQVEVEKEKDDKEEEEQEEGCYLPDCPPQIPTSQSQNSWLVYPGQLVSWSLACSSEERHY